MKIDRQLAWAMLLCAAVTMLRGAYIIACQSPCIDDNYHLYRGLLYLRGDLADLRQTPLNDPPLGEALSAIPAWINGARVPDPALAVSIALKQAPPGRLCYSLPQRVALETALWKALLFLPMMAVVFLWARALYGAGSAWLAIVLLLAEPTVAAHLPLPTVDILGVEGIVIGCWAAWRFVQLPTFWRGVAAAVAIGVALLLKHTALLLPVVLAIYAAMQWLGREHWAGWGPIARRAGALAAVGGGILLVMWLLLGMDISPAPGGWLGHHATPLGVYWKSIAQATTHDHNGHKGFLLGQYRSTGWWYYYAVVATYKVPIGTGIVLALGLASLMWRRPRYAELGLLIPAVVWGIALSAQHIDIGFRHFLPAYVFLLMLAARCVEGSRGGKLVTSLAWAAAAVAVIHVALWTPDDLSFINFPRRAAYLDISDSNIDWGQSIKEIRTWMTKHPRERRPIYVGYFGPFSVNLYDELGPRLSGYSNRVFWLASPDGTKVVGAMPQSGLLILSPVMLSGQYDPADRFAPLRKVQPREMIGNCMLIYDLDRIRGEN